MRDPARIDIIVEALRTAWKKDPDQRLGQLLDNISYLDGTRSSYRTEFRLQEDDKWNHQLKQWIVDHD